MASEETLLPKQMFPCLHAHSTFVADANLRPRRKKCSWIFSETFCVRNKYFPVCSRRKQCWLVPGREMFLGLRSKEAKHLFYFPLVCSPTKHYVQQCFFVCHDLNSYLFEQPLYSLTIQLMIWRSYSRSSRRRPPSSGIRKSSRN